MITVNITWEKFDFDPDEIRKLSKACDYGIYQIYGTHAAYGKDALLYIGIASLQTFASRLSERWEFIESCFVPHTLRVGRIVQSTCRLPIFSTHQK